MGVVLAVVIAVVVMEVRSYERDGRMYLDGGSYHEVWTVLISTISTRNGWTCVSIRRGMYARSCR